MDLAKELILAVKRNNSRGGYGLQKECEALIGHVLTNMVKSNMPKLIADVKNDEAAIKYREEGNQCFVMGDDDDAVEKYTKSLAYSTSKESMAFAFANRSAALYRKQLYVECLIDIDAAIAHGYPEEKKKNLKKRAEKAAAGALRQIYQGEDLNMNNGKDLNMKNGKDLNMNDLPMTKETSLSLEIDENDYALEHKSNVEILKEIITSKIKSEGEFDKKTSVEELLSKIPKPPPKYLIEEKELALAHGPSEEAPALSKGVKISYNDKYGRHLVATESFMPGDIVAIEKPFAYVIYREKYYTHCHHCLVRSCNLIPCIKCPIAQYCSEKCRTEDWKMAHKIECPIYAVLANLLNVDGDKIRILTKILRLLLIATDNGKSIDELRKDAAIAEKNSDNRTAGFTDDGIFDSSSPRSALSLATNLAVRPLSETSAFACISALAAILLATETTFFGKKYRWGQLKNIVKHDDVRFCGTLIFRNCVIVSSNSFSIQQEPGIKVGSGLYNTHSLMNHSCGPNTFRHFNGLTMISRALEPIKEGDQIFTCYGGGYQYMARAERKNKMMTEYFFDCDCQACIEDWPTYADILRNHIGSIAKTNKSLVEKLKPFRESLLKDKYDINAVKTILDILFAEVKMPCEEIVHAVQYLKSYYLDL